MIPYETSPDSLCPLGRVKPMRYDALALGKERNRPDAFETNLPGRSTDSSPHSRDSCQKTLKVS